MDYRSYNFFTQSGFNSSDESDFDSSSEQEDFFLTQENYSIPPESPRENGSILNNRNDFSEMATNQPPSQNLNTQTHQEQNTNHGNNEPSQSGEIVIVIENNEKEEVRPIPQFLKRKVKQTKKRGKEKIKSKRKGQTLNSSHVFLSHLKRKLCELGNKICERKCFRQGEKIGRTFKVQEIENILNDKKFKDFIRVTQTPQQTPLLNNLNNCTIKQFTYAFIVRKMDTPERRNKFFELGGSSRGNGLLLYEQEEDEEMELINAINNNIDVLGNFHDLTKKRYIKKNNNLSDTEIKNEMEKYETKLRNNLVTLLGIQGDL